MAVLIVIAKLLVGDVRLPLHEKELPVHARLPVVLMYPRQYF